MTNHHKGGKSAKRRSAKSKKGGSFGALMAQLAAPAVLFSANHVYGKKTRRHRKKSSKSRKRRNKKSAKRSRKYRK